MNKFYPLTEKENVINLQGNPDNDYHFIYNHPMFKLDNLEKKMLCKILGVSSWKQIEEQDHYKNRKKWLVEGLDCEILSLGAKKWQKGKLRVNLTIEFCPDKPEEIKPESPLDDIRKTING
ncbi:MAG: KGK domain-containing protein [Xenococcaceae cyanobacterium MO_188.B32]|nr:KGK domain-containing protein [Xenococcaceae cyanobacterium MO_188.B32]